MSSFFTLSASQRKRKREDATDAQSTKKRLGARSNLKDSRTAQTRRHERDESISSGSSENDAVRARGDEEESHSVASSDSDNETAAERRLRLAEQYLENIKGEVDEAGFDAEQVDKDLIAERLQEDIVCNRICTDLHAIIITDRPSRQRTRAVSTAM